MTICIGFGGYLESGKDAAADYLVETHNFVKIGMSDPLHEAILIMNPWVNWPAKEEFLWVSEWAHGQIAIYSEIEERFGYVQAKEIPFVRAWLQAMGTEVGRELIDDNVWVDVAKKKILELGRQGINTVITGIRFPNELEMLGDLAYVDDTWGPGSSEEEDVRSVSGYSVWVDRPSKRPAEGTELHASEASVKPEDFTLVLANDKTLEELPDAVDDLLETILGDLVD